MKRFTALLLAFFAACCLAGAREEYPGLIEGNVTYEDGRPVKGATVSAQPIDRPMYSIVPHADTDETGHFSINRLWLGKFAVTAKKEDEAYPDMSFQFYSDGRFERVTLTRDHPTATVALLLGPKAGILSGTVSDATTGAPLYPCVDLRRASEPNSFLTGSGLVKPNYRLLIPSNADVLVKVWLNGYLPWYYPGTMDKSESKPARLKPGEERTLDIRLQPASDVADLHCQPPVGQSITMTAAKTAERSKQGNKQRQYTSPDGGMRVVVVPVGKEVGRSEHESSIEFQSRDGKIACALDYSSDDGEHGFGVVKAEWTADSQFFVFSLTSSGGHQPWHHPTQFLSRKDRTVRTLDDYFESGISNADFQLFAPNTIKTEIWEDKSVPVSVKLAALPPLRSWRKSKPFSIDCAGGRVFKPDQP